MATSKSYNMMELDFFKREEKLLIPKPQMNQRQPYALSLLNKRNQGATVNNDVRQHIGELGSAKCALYLHKAELENKEEEQMKQRIQNSCLLRLCEQQQLFSKRNSRLNAELNEQNREHLRNLREELDTLLVQRKQLEEEIEKRRIFMEFMREAVKASKFKDLHELIVHYHQIKQIQQDLLAAVDEGRKGLMKCEHDLDGMKKELVANQMMTRTKLETLMQELEGAEQDVVKWVALWEEVQQSANTKELQMNEICQATYNLSRHLSKTDSQASEGVSLGNTMEVLDKVQDFICDLKSILEELSKAEE